MGQEIGPPIDHFRTQKAPKTDETLRAVFNTLIQAYDAARQGRITDSKTLRLIARQFEAIADSPEASDLFPYDAGRAAATLYNWALDLDMRIRDRASSQVVHTAHDVIKPLDRSTHFVDNTRDLAQPNTSERDRQTQKRVKESGGKAMIPEQKPEVSGAAREIKITPGIQLDLVNPAITWRAMLELAKIGEEEFIEGEGVKSSIDHNSIWDEWEG